MLQGRQVPTNAGQAGFDFVKQLEGFKTDVHLDPIKIPTVGVGYALLVKDPSTDVFSVRTTLQSDFTGIHTFSSAELQLLVNIAKELSPPNNQVAAEALFSSKGAGVLDFMLKSDPNTDARKLFDAVINRDVAAAIPQDIRTALAGTYELIALNSLAYNASDLVGPKLESAIRAGDRAEAWYEILYNSGSVATAGVAKRRLEESHIFGLYEDKAAADGNSNYVPPELEALQVFRMFTKHEQDISVDDPLFLQSANVGTVSQPVFKTVLQLARGDFAAVGGINANLNSSAIGMVQLRSDSFEVAFDYLNQRFLSLDQGTFRSQDVGLDGQKMLRAEIDQAVQNAINTDPNVNSIDDLPLFKTLLGLNANLKGIFVAALTQASGSNEVAAHTVDRTAATAQNDLIFGDSEDASEPDTLKAGGGDDFVVASQGADVIDGGAGIDTVTYAASTAGVTIALDNKAGSGGLAAGDKLDNIEIVIGSTFDDQITGNAQDNALIGLAGKDIITGGGGSDFIVSGLGHDNLFGDEENGGGSGNDFVFGGDGADLLIGGAGDDVLFGGPGNDVLFGHYVSLPLTTFTISRAAWDSTGAVTLPVGSTSILDGGPGNDVLLPGNNLAETAPQFAARGSTAQVQALSPPSTIIFREGYGHDVTLLETGATQSDGGTGAAMVQFLGISSDQVSFVTNPANDPADTNGLISGRAPIVVVLNEQDTLGIPRIGRGHGLNEEFLFFSDRGMSFADILAGPVGVREFPAEWNMNIDQTWREDSTNTPFDPFNNQRMGGENIAGTEEADDLSGTAANDTITGLGGDDTLSGGAGDDILNGGAANDTLDGGTGNDVVEGGAGDDLILGGSGAGDDTLNGGSGTDTVTFASTTLGVTVDLAAGTALGAETGSDSLANLENVIGGDGDDIITSGAGNNELDGGAGTDIAVFAGLFADYAVTLGQGQVTLSGPQGTDTLRNIETLRFDDQDVLVGALNQAPTDLSLSGVSVAENAASGTLVGTASAVDPDSSGGFSYALLDDAEGRFAIDAVSGAVTAADGTLLDHETAASHAITVEVTDAGGARYSEDFTLFVGNVNEAPVANDLVASVLENQPGGTVVGTVIASDPDLIVPFNSLRYAITAGNGGGGLFRIDELTGVITTLNPLDHEAAAEHSLTITVTDKAGLGLSDTATVVVSVGDVNEAPVASDLNVGLSEDVAAGTVVGTVAASDPDPAAPFNSLSYAITGGNAAGLFAIDAASGLVTTTGALDFETATLHSLTVTATDGGTPGLGDTATVQVFVSNMNEAPVAEDLATSVLENQPGGTVVGTVIASDPDLIVPFNSLRYAITAGNGGGGLFRIDELTGVITTLNPLDHEAAAEHSLTITVTDKAGLGLSDTATVVVSVGDVNEAPVASDLNVGLAENLPGGTVVGTMAANDPDVNSPVFGNLAYSITAGNETGQFAIDGSSGAISTIGPLDHETAGQRNLTVTVTDGGALSDTAQVTVMVNDVNEVPTDILLSNVSVEENAETGTLVGLLSSVDPDVGDTATFILLGDAAGRFRIVGDELQVANGLLLDFETVASHDVTVQVTDSGGLTLDKTITIALTDLNEIATEGRDMIFGTPGSDMIDGLAGNDIIFGRSGDDLLLGGAGRDFLDGGPGNDSLDGGDGDDTAAYGGATQGVIVDLAAGTATGLDSGNDVLINIERAASGAGDDQLIGDAGGNALSGGAGNDQLQGNAGRDYLTGNDGADTLDGGPGNDELNGGAGDDLLIGGTGSDTFVFFQGHTQDTVQDFGFNDYLDVSPYDLTGIGDLTIRQGEQPTDTVIELGGGDTITLVGVASDTVNAYDFIFSPASG